MVFLAVLKNPELPLIFPFLLFLHIHTTCRVYGFFPVIVLASPSLQWDTAQGELTAESLGYVLH